MINYILDEVFWPDEETLRESLMKFDSQEIEVYNLTKRNDPHFDHRSVFFRRVFNHLAMIYGKKSETAVTKEKVAFTEEVMSSLPIFYKALISMIEQDLKVITGDKTEIEKEFESAKINQDISVMFNLRVKTNQMSPSFFRLKLPKSRKNGITSHHKVNHKYD